MPNIPEYEHRALYPVTPMPRAPMRSPVAETLERVGATAQAIGQKFGREELEIKRTSEMIDRYTAASTELSELRTKTLASSDFFTNPITAGNNFAEQTKAIGAKYLSSIKDPAEQVMFKKHWAIESLHAMGEMSTTAAIQQRNMGAGIYYTAISRLGAIADNAPTDVDAQRYMGQAQATFNLMQQTGLIKPQDAAKLKEKWMGQRAENRGLLEIGKNPAQALQDIQEGNGIFSLLPANRRTALAEHAQRAVDHQTGVQQKQAEQQKKEEAQLAYTHSYGMVHDAYHLGGKDADYPGATAFLADPRNQQALGITPEQAQKITADLSTQRKMNEEYETKQVKVAGDTLMNEAIAGRIAPDQVETYKDKQGIEPTAQAKENALRWMNSDDNRKNRTDPELYTKLVSDIDARKITNKDDLNQYVAAGLSKTDYAALRKHVDALADPDKEGGIKYAETAFKAKYINQAGMVPPEVAALYPRFITQYEKAVSDQGLKGFQTHELADKMLADVDKKVISSWRGWKTGTALEYAESWGSWPEPRIGGPAETDPDAPYRDYLTQHGYPTTDANIKALREQGPAQ